MTEKKNISPLENVFLDIVYMHFLGNDEIGDETEKLITVVSKDKWILSTNGFSFIIVNTNNIENREIEIPETVYGNVIQALDDGRKELNTFKIIKSIEIITNKKWKDRLDKISKIYNNFIHSLKFNIRSFDDIVEISNMYEYFMKTLKDKNQNMEFSVNASVFIRMMEIIIHELGEKEFTIGWTYNPEYNVFLLEVIVEKDNIRIVWGRGIL